MQYTVRNISAQLDEQIRKRMKAEGLSLNETILRLLRHALGVEESPIERDLSDIVGSWVDEPELEIGLSEQRTIDEEIWR